MAGRAGSRPRVNVAMQRYNAVKAGDCFCLRREAFLAVRETPCLCGFQGGRKLVARILKLVARILKLVACFFKYVGHDFFLVEIFICKKTIACRRCAERRVKCAGAHHPRGMRTCFTTEKALIFWQKGIVCANLQLYFKIAQTENGCFQFSLRSPFTYFVLRTEYRIRFGIAKLKNCVFRFFLRSPFTYFVLRTEYRRRLGNTK